MKKPKPTVNKKRASKLRSLFSNPKILLPVLFALVLGSAGTYSLTGSHALTTINPPTSLTVSVVSPTSTQLYWWPSTTVPAPGYNVFRNNVKIFYVGSWISFDGRVNYTDTGLTPGTSYTYYVQAANADGTATANSAPVTVTTSQSPTAAQLGTISGKVLGTRKAPVVGATVSIIYSGQTVTATSAADGSFTLPNIPAGSYSLGISAAGYKSTTARVNVVGGQPVNVQVSLKAAR